MEKTFTGDLARESLSEIKQLGPKFHSFNVIDL